MQQKPKLYGTTKLLLPHSKQNKKPHPNLIKIITAYAPGAMVEEGCRAVCRESRMKRQVRASAQVIVLTSV